MTSVGKVADTQSIVHQNIYCYLLQIFFKDLLWISEKLFWILRIFTIWKIILDQIFKSQLDIFSILKPVFLALHVFLLFKHILLAYYCLLIIFPIVMKIEKIRKYWKGKMRQETRSLSPFYILVTCLKPGNIHNDHISLFCSMEWCETQNLLFHWK